MGQASGRILERYGIILLMIQIQIQTKPFDFSKLILSHGWVFLAPFTWLGNRTRLHRTLCDEKGNNVNFQISEKGNNNCSLVIARSSDVSTISIGSRRDFRMQIRRMLRLDEDFSHFHLMCGTDPILRFVDKHKCGGLLRSPTAFEDLVKTICTTNCDWRNTKKMCEALCKLGGVNFPLPADILKYTPKKLAKLAPLGYRSGTIHNVARLTENGRLPLDKWSQEGDFDMIRHSLLEIRGIGPYCANHMLVLLGYYGNIPVDSEVLKYLSLHHFNGRSVSEKEAIEPYVKFGTHMFLAYKFSRMARKLNYIDK